MAALIPILSSLISAGGAIGSGLLGRNANKETPIQGKQREVIDQILESISVQGPFSDLFNVDEQSFQKSFVEPAKSMFRNEIAPQIQQQYIASGQQRGTGLEDTLARAGVDLDQLLNQFYFQQQQGAQNRQLSGLERILGMGSGAQSRPTFGEAASQAGAGYLSSPGFGSDISGILNQFSSPRKRKGFEDDIAAGPYNKGATYNPYTGVQS
jgi:hypothetical protein